MFRRHGRFLAALLVGAIAGLAAPGDALFRLALGIDLFCCVYIVLMLVLALRITPAGLRDHAGDADEGIPVISILAVMVVVASLGAIFLVLNGPGRVPTVDLVVSLAGLPLGWAMLQTVAAFHYARLYYGPRGRRGADGGLKFEGADEPGVWEFFYYAFTVGMTAQVSDTVVTSTAMRRTTLAHAVLSFFYNTVILALAVNAAVALRG